MEFASLQDAFPHLGDSDQSDRKKKVRKQKEGFQAYELPPTDPDRPAVKRMLEIPPINQQDAGDSMDEYLDESTKFQKKMTVNNSLPSPRSTLKLESSKMPSFFGAEPFTNPSEDTLALFTGNVTNPNGYMLDADFTKSFDQTGFGRSTGVSIPVPELRHRWKPLSADRIDTAYTDGSKGQQQFNILEMSDMTAMKSKLDALMARLDELEDRAAGANPQLEMLSFIMTGLFLMFVLDVTVRKSSGMRLVNVR
jgi:hypothetical protein